MLWGKKKSYSLVQSTNKQKKAAATNGFYTKVNSSKKISPSSSCYQQLPQVHQKA